MCCMYVIGIVNGVNTCRVWRTIIDMLLLQIAAPIVPDRKQASGMSVCPASLYRLIWDCWRATKMCHERGGESYVCRISWVEDVPLPNQTAVICLQCDIHIFLYAFCFEIQCHVSPKQDWYTHSILDEPKRQILLLWSAWWIISKYIRSWYQNVMEHHLVGDYVIIWVCDESWMVTDELHSLSIVARTISVRC